MKERGKGVLGISSVGKNGWPISFQDCSDDGESG